MTTATDTLAYCHGCKMYRLCRRYRGYWICVPNEAVPGARGRCWRHRKRLVAGWNALKERSR